MTFPIREALKSGAESVTAWADYLDAINVFPVADGDTGRNLVLSLAPLRNVTRRRPELLRELLLQARGNSGNLASQFLVGLLEAEAWEQLPAAAARGSELAHKSIPDPKAGTILSFFAALDAQLSLRTNGALAENLELVFDELEKTVRNTTNQLSKLRAAGVVDAGALGMFFFFEGFFGALTGQTGTGFAKSRFAQALHLGGHDAASRPQISQAPIENGFCVDVALQANRLPEDAKQLTSLGDSVVAVRHDGFLKIHFHTDDAEAAKARLAQLGAVVQFSADDLREQTTRFAAARQAGAHRAVPLHIMTDAAGSVTRADAERYGFTLADSYIQIGDKSLPETYLDPQVLYRAMRDGVNVSTSQASTYERQQYFRKTLGVHQRVLYLCVGSVFTGNFAAATQWKKENDPENRLILVDTSAASGRLGVLALAVARFSLTAGTAQDVLEFAKKAAARCEEYIFVDQLRFLAAGGRMPKAVSFVGDLLSFKPVISPMADGAKPVGWVKNRDAQLAFAIERLERNLGGHHAVSRTQNPATIMLEYTDNRDWAAGALRETIAARFPEAEVIVQPFSLTTGAHVGPGTWGVGFLPPIS